MTEHHDLARALKTARTARGLRQEAFSDVSSRTYLSTVERGLKNPTWAKVVELCEVMQVHPATLAILAEAENVDQADALLARVQEEVRAILGPLRAKDRT